MRIKLDLPLSVSQICTAVNAAIPSNTNTEACVSAICTDTRECAEGDLFIALSGENDSGEKYIEYAIAKKCQIISCSDNKRVIRVQDTQEALLSLSRVYKAMISPTYTVAITGSVGKSTTVKFTSVILGQKFKVHSTIGNFNNLLGVPLTVFAMPKNTEVLVTEFGMNRKGEISKLSQTVNPNVATITSIGTAHIGNLGSREAIANAKLEILDGMSNGSLLLPKDEALLSRITNAMYVGRNSSLSYFSLNDADNDLYSYRSASKLIDGISFFDKREHILTDLAFALTIADTLGLSEKEMIDGVNAISETNLRQRFIEIEDFTIFDDSYNASLESITANLKFITSLQRPSGAFLGDVLELGDHADEIHRKIGSIAASLHVGRLYLYGNYAEQVAYGALTSGMNAECIFINTDTASPDVSINQIYKYHVPGEVILFKASHKLRLDKIADLMKNTKGS